ncbi:MAG: hypothetical protein AAB510_01995 [Patescibacteria group bacterium]
MKTYKIKKSHILGNSIFLIFPLVMTLIILTEEGGAQQNEWIGVGIFWLIGVLVLVLLSGSKMEVGTDYIRPYFFGFPRRKIEASNIEVLEYGNLFRGGLGVGKGLKMWVKTSKGRKALTVGEKAYGKEAIDHMKSVLESKSLR